jgi:carbon monoxide dehydrogenase subunit G
MQLEQSFRIGRPIDEVWAALTDLAFVAACVPGAELTGRDDDGTYHGQMTVRLGSIRAAFKGTAALSEVDFVSRQVVLRAEGGGTQGHLRLEIQGRAVPHGETVTEIELRTGVDMSGRIAQLGHGAAVAVTARLISQLADTLEQRLSGTMPIGPVGSALTVSSVIGIVAPALLADRRVRMVVTAVLGFGAGAGWAWRRP